MKMPPKKNISSKLLKTPAVSLATGHSLSMYATGLSADHLQRYLDKISVIGNQDPYLLNMKSSHLPETICYESIIDYALFKQSAYSGQFFQCFKAVEAKKRFESGMVKLVEGAPLGEFYAVRGKVMHSMSLNDPCLTPWLIVKGRDVISAHCDCIAGIGEVCSHVGAVLYYLTNMHYNQLVHNGPSNVLAVTDVEQRWGRPTKSIPGNLQLPLDKIDFETIHSSSDDAYGNVPMLLIKDIRDKLNELQKKEVQCTAMQTFCTKQNACFKCQKIEKDPSIALQPILLTDLYDKNNREISIEGLRFKSLTLYAKMQKEINHDIRLQVERDTRAQSSCDLWSLMRIGRVTASMLKNVLSTKIENPSISLLNAICYPDKSYFSTQATRYGKKMEKTALRQVADILVKSHVKATVGETGLIIHKQFPELAASPDGILNCECCGRVPIEVKCPFNFKEEDNVMLRLSKCKPACIAKTNAGFEMVQNHKYFAQVQMQIALTEAHYGYFYIWTKKQTF
ncbi:uncharacterized protein LOC131694265 [Topomyia yanbarensis]|uniref:uncharacterized protein LOC131694265 n=1 Tax=Topomyia yanbarensis TaxID=2498891 RepID=UPI00273B58CC|nr:uncharacterized protein LOC131694265 [Topomyia yanbarensis]